MPIVFAAIVLTLLAQQLPRDPVPAFPKGTAVVRGRVVAPAAPGTTRPVAGATVSLRTFQAGPARPQLVSTDAAGKFEFTDVPAAGYTVVASPAMHLRQFLPAEWMDITVADGQTVEGLELVLRRAGVIVGHLVDEFGQPAGGVLVSVSSVNSPRDASSASAMSDELGRFRAFSLGPGAYYLSVRPGRYVDPNAPGARGLLETYYHGTLARGEAAIIDVRAGEETDIGDLTVPSGRYSRVRGMVLDARGLPAPPNRTTVTWSCKNGYMGRGIDAQSRFEFRPGPPGSCRIVATLRGENGQTIDQYEQYAAQPVTLADADVDVRLAMKPVTPLKGRIVIENGMPPPTAALSVFVVRPYRGESWHETAPVARDLTFTFPRIAGEALLRIDGTAGGYLLLKAVMRGNEDVTDIPTEFNAEDDVRIILAPLNSRVEGTVTDKDGKPAVSMAVILFSEDRRTWVSGSTRVQTLIRTDRAGHYVAWARPGRYYLVAVPIARAVASPDAVEPALLEPLVKDATIVVIAPGERRVVDLQAKGSGGGGY